MNKLLLFGLLATFDPSAWFVDHNAAVALDLERECAIAVTWSVSLGATISLYDRDQPSHNHPGWRTFRIDQFNYTLHGDQVGNTWVATQLEDPEVALVVHAIKYGNTLSVYKDGEQISSYPLEGSARAIRIATKQ